MPLLVKVTLPITVTVDPEKIEKAREALTEPPVIVHAVLTRLRVLFAAIVEPVLNAIDPLPPKTPSETKMANPLASVSVPPSCSKYQSRIEPALLPSVFAVMATATAMLENVRFLAAPSVPPHVKGTVKDVTGGTNRTDVSTTTIEAI